MKLIENWRVVAAKAHSMWAFYLSLACLLAPEIIFALFERDTNPRFWWGMGVVLLIYGIVFRLKDQGIDRSTLRSPWALGVFLLFVGLAFVSGERVPSQQAQSSDHLRGQVEQVLTAKKGQDAFTSLAVEFIGKWEGLRLTAYQDIVGVWTVCFGETKGVQPGDTHTRAQCEAMLAREVTAYRDGLRAYLSADTVTHRLPVTRDVAMTSLAYNVGVAGAGKSTAVRRLNGGNVLGACQALTWWNKAGGRVVRGLVNRRAEEQAMCLQNAA